jgi:hypothetical protein
MRQRLSFFVDKTLMASLFPWSSAWIFCVPFFARKNCQLRKSSIFYSNERKAQKKQSWRYDPFLCQVSWCIIQKTQDHRSVDKGVYSLVVYSPTIEVYSSVYDVDVTFFRRLPYCGAQNFVVNIIYYIIYIILPTFSHKYFLWPFLYFPSSDILNYVMQFKLEFSSAFLRFSNFLTPWRDSNPNNRMWWPLRQ